MCTQLRYAALFLVVAADLLACCKNNSAVTNSRESSTMVDAGGFSAESAMRFNKDDSARSSLDTDAGDGTRAGPASSVSGTTASKADIARIRNCCRTFEKLGEVRKNQEGVGLIGLSSVCDDIASSIEHGEAPALNYSDWEEIRPVLDDRSVPASCRTVMLKFEKR